MKQWLTTSLLLAALSAAPAMAQTAPVGSGDGATTPSPAERGHERFVAADADHDGRLSRTEAQAMPFVAKHFDAIDTNHDGYVSADELRAARMQVRAARAQRQGQNGQEPAGGASPPAQGTPGSGT